MAKRRKEKDEDEDKPFKLPKFDEKKFLKREKRNIKTTFLSFLLGVLVALISFGFYALLTGNSLRWYLLFFFAIFTGSWLKYLFVRLKIDLTDFTKKNWFSSYMIYFFTWLVVLSVIVNPPFYDEEAPLVELIVIPDMQEPGGTVMILAKITDNSGIEKENIEFSIDGNATNNFEYKNNIFRYTYEGPQTIKEDEKHRYTITVTDPKGNTNKNEGTFTFSNNTLDISDPVGVNKYPGPQVGEDTTIKFKLKTYASRVYYTVDNSKEINATYNKDEERYKTKPIKKGWPNNNQTVVTIKPYAEIIFYFQNIDEEFRNTIVDTSEYYFNVTKNDDIGTEKSEKISLPGPTYVTAPGFELLVLIILLIIITLIFKYRKKNRKT